MQNKCKIIENIEELKNIQRDCNFNKPFLCCSDSFEKTDEFSYICTEFNTVVWDKIRPNPRWEDMVEASELFKSTKCDFIIAAGGGSVIDSAKCIKLLTTNNSETALDMPMAGNNIKFLAIPTTSGTGSEVTRYSIFYVNGDEKHSIANDDFLPDYVFLDAKFLNTVPDYQRKCTCLDALCHAIESYWNVFSNDESKNYAKRAIKLFTDNKQQYLMNEHDGNYGMLMASYYAGKAINITSTTAAHALCYNVTMNCNTAHGHSVALMLESQWKYMNENNMDVNDKRGRAYVLNVLDDVGKMLGGKDSIEGQKIFHSMIDEFKLARPKVSKEKIESFVANVNMNKLQNNPTALNKQDVYCIYETALCAEN